MPFCRNDFMPADLGPRCLAPEGGDEVQGAAGTVTPENGALPSLSDLRSLFRDVSKSWCELQGAMGDLAASLGPERVDEAIRTDRRTGCGPVSRAGAPSDTRFSRTVASPRGRPGCGLRETAPGSGSTGPHEFPGSVAERLGELLDRLRKRLPPASTQRIVQGAMAELDPRVP